MKNKELLKKARIIELNELKNIKHDLENDLFRYLKEKYPNDNNIKFLVSKIIRYDLSVRNVEDIIKDINGSK